MKCAAIGVLGVGLMLGGCDAGESGTPIPAPGAGATGGAGAAGGSVTGGTGGSGTAGMASGAAPSGGTGGGGTALGGAAGSGATGGAVDSRIRVILDSDANNELDDQHAIAYTLFNADVFDIEAITVNNTYNGGGIAGQVAEADRVVQMCASTSVPVLAGAEGNYLAIRGQVNDATFDGHEAVNFIIERANAADSRQLLLLPVGKLTNVALALEKDPGIIPRVRVVWLGANWPAAGEYNLDNDTDSVNAVIDSGVELHIVTVRYGQPSGTDAVRVTTSEMEATMPGLGPQVDPPVQGRSGGTFANFGDYSVELFRASGSYDRALFDMAAVAVAKDPSWAQVVTVPAPMLSGSAWQDRPDNPRTIVFYENFNRDAIIADFFDTMHNPALPQ